MLGLAREIPHVGVKPFTQLADTGSCRAGRSRLPSTLVRSGEARWRPPASDRHRRDRTDRTAAAPPRDDGWLDRWMETVADLARLKASHPMLDAVIDEQDRPQDPDRRSAGSSTSRRCNYLGFDLDQEIIDAVPGVPRRVGHAPDRGRGSSAAR